MFLHKNLLPFRLDFGVILFFLKLVLFHIKIMNCFYEWGNVNAYVYFALSVPVWKE